MKLLPLNDTVFGEPLVRDAPSKILFTPAQKLDNSFRVIAVGPDCKELQVGDVGLVESLSGTMVSIYDENDELHRYYLIREANVLAVYKEEPAIALVKD